MEGILWTVNGSRLKSSAREAEKWFHVHIIQASKTHPRNGSGLWADIAYATATPRKVFFSHRKWSNQLLEGWKLMETDGLECAEFVIQRYNPTMTAACQRRPFMRCRYLEMCIGGILNRKLRDPPKKMQEHTRLIIRPFIIDNVKIIIESPFYVKLGNPASMREIHSRCPKYIQMV